MIPNVSATNGGKAIRVVLAHKPRVFEIDLDNKQVVRTPPDALHLARARHHTGPSAAVWHPSQNLLAISRRGRTIVVNPEATYQVALPAGTYPHLWTTVQTLLALSDDGGNIFLELWRVSA